MRYFDPLILRHVGGKKKFLMDREMRCEAWDGTVIYLPAGCSVNGFSFPRVIWPIFDPFGNHLKAAAQHDVLYETKDFSRKKTDDFFLESLLSLGEDEVLAYTMYAAVRAAGGDEWND